jgi:5-methylcytosine-specific restriction endonuclease McrA
MITCPYCGATDKQYGKGFGINGLPRYRCVPCGRQYTPNTTPHPKRRTIALNVIQCTNCGNETTNPKFCSTSCAVSYNNHLIPKRIKKQRFCKHCGVEIGERRQVCDNCVPNQVDWSKRTLGEVQSAAKYQINAVARDLARQVYKQANLPRVCQNCGYSKHVEICHIIAVKDFPRETPMSVVSSIDNLVALCPNCHWEFDHGQLHYDDIAPR